MTNKELLEYCRKNIDGFDRMESEALDAIDHMRCPLISASPKLYWAMYDSISELCNDKGEDMDDLGIDIEAVFWEED